MQFFLARTTPGTTLIHAKKSIAWLAMALCAGCGGNAAPQSQPATPPVSGNGSGEVPSVSAGVTGASAGTNTAGAKTHRRDEVWEDEKGQKWFGNVPMDVFFDEPYAVASDKTAVAGPVAAANDSSGNASPETAPPPEKSANAVTANSAADASDKSDTGASAEGDGWKPLISASMLDEEVKSIRNFLAENTQSVGNYNSSMLMLPPKAATLAMLAGIAIEHPDAVTWKQDAKYIRDLAKKMNASTLQRGPRDQKRLLELSEAISDTLNRSRPAGLEEPPESDSFAETADMRLLMNRMEDAEKRMKTEAGTAGAFSSKKELVLLESSMLAVTARTITLNGYGYETDEEFKGYASSILKACQSIREASESGDFATYETALTTIATSCSNCHMKYRSE